MNRIELLYPVLEKSDSHVAKGLGVLAHNESARPMLTACFVIGYAPLAANPA
jgi:hypothetical protein